MLVGVIAEESLMPSAIVDSLIVREVADAADIVDVGFVFSLLVDDPASVADIVDAYLGEIMLEVASASDIFTTGLIYAVSIDEVISAADTPDATVAGATVARQAMVLGAFVNTGTTSRAAFVGSVMLNQ